MEKAFLPEDLVPKSLMDQFRSLLKCALGGWDRLRFHASLRRLFSPQWMRTYLYAAQIRLVEFAAHARALTTGAVAARFQRQVRTDVLSRHEDVCLKHRAGFNGQKAYDKF